MNYGNFSAPIFGQTLDLTSLLATYGIGGSSAYSKALLTATPTTWLDIYGQFLFSQPNSHVNYQQTDAGNLYLQSQILFYSSEQYLIAAEAEQPHTTASLGAEIRPFKRVRIVESWMTDRLHESGSAASTGSLLNPFASIPLSSLLATTLASNYSQEAIDVYFDATSKLTLRGGYRYVWGDASYAFLPAAGLASSDQEQLRRNVGVGGVTFRPSQKVSVTGEFEGASSSGVYFRTSLYNYEKVRAQVHYQPLQSLSVSADFTLLNNQNPLPGLNYEYSSHQESLSFYWSPRASKIFDIQGSYSRSDLKSNIGYLDPGTLSPQISSYRDNAHTATALIDLAWPHGKRFAPKLAAGGSFFISSGSQPTSYYQPMAKLWLPIGKHVSWFSEWRYYGYGETFNLYEGFRTHLVITGVRFTPMNRALILLLRFLVWGVRRKLLGRFGPGRAPVSNAFLHPMPQRERNRRNCRARPWPSHGPRLQSCVTRRHHVESRAHHVGLHARASDHGRRVGPARSAGPDGVLLRSAFL